MSDLEKALAANIADQISQGLVSYNRARKQLESMGSTPGLTIDVGNVIEWLDKNVKRIGYEEESDESGVVQAVDHTGYYSGKTDSFHDMPEARGYHNMLDAAKTDAIEAKANPYLVTRPGQQRINVHELAKAQEGVIDVSARIKELTSRADEELGIIDADPAD